MGTQGVNDTTVVADDVTASLVDMLHGVDQLLEGRKVTLQLLDGRTTELDDLLVAGPAGWVLLVEPLPLLLGEVVDNGQP